MKTFIDILFILCAIAYVCLFAVGVFIAFCFFAADKTRKI